MDCGARYGVSRSGFFKQAKAIFPHNQSAEGGKGGIFGEFAVLGQASAVRSREVVAAVSKKGHRLSHVDLGAAVWTNPAENAGSGVGDDANRFIDDVHGFGLHNNRCNGFFAADGDLHAAHVAGTAARGDARPIVRTGIGGRIGDRDSSRGVPYRETPRGAVV